MYRGYVNFSKYTYDVESNVIVGTARVDNGHGVPSAEVLRHEALPRYLHYRRHRQGCGFNSAHTCAVRAWFSIEDAHRKRFVLINRARGLSLSWRVCRGEFWIWRFGFMLMLVMFYTVCATAKLNFRNFVMLAWNVPRYNINI